MRLEAVIVCKDYSDFLRETLPLNLPHFDDVCVVTHPDDKATKTVCNHLSVECVTTTDFTKFGNSFNKGRAINLGLNHLQQTDWLLHLDADIVLPYNFRNLLHRSELNKDDIHGADRVNVYGWDAWQKIKNSKVNPYTEKWFIDPGFCHAEKAPEGMRFGARVVHAQYGYVPIGFFQLWHGSKGMQYNYRRGAAAGADVLFPAQWPRENRILLPEVVCYHLDSELKHKIGTNWKGRKSAPFKKA